jgi:hypothetical protein
LFAYGIFKVIYSPFKAFKEIIEKPKYTGPILIIVLFALANTGFGYAFLSKAYFDQTIPPGSNLDEWTENCTLWMSNADTPMCSEDHISGIYYGNRSIKFTIDNGSQIWMRLNITNPVNCLSPGGYRKLSFRAKWIRTDEVRPNVTIRLFSTSSDYFCCDLTQNFTESKSNVWNNLTIPLGSENERWENSSANVHWDNINGLGLNFTWTSLSNTTVLIDGLFFHGVFKPVIEISIGYLFNYPLTAFMQFILQWVILGGSLYIFCKVFGANAIWKVLLTVAGFALITLFMQTIITTAAIAASPEIHYPLKALGGVPGEAEASYNYIFEQTQLLYQFISYLEIVMGVWAAVLCAIAIHLLSEFSWIKSLLMAALAYLAYFVVMNMVLPFLL